jgi:hypothetical protein
MMTVGETMKKLVMAEDYNTVRATISDEFVEMAKCMLGDFDYIKEKEEKYQELIKYLNKI